MRQLPLLQSPLLGVLACAGVLALVACGSIVDPARSENVATVRGALSSAEVPANTRVALVWRAGAQRAWAVGNDVPVTNGSFAMNLSAPKESYLFGTEDVGFDTDEQYDDGPSVDVPPAPPPMPVDAGAPGLGSSSLSPLDTTGGAIGKPLRLAIAGFIVYVDTNGNGKLDLDSTNAVATDNVIGGSRQLLLTYFKDGGALDYEEMRDELGTLPHAGYNLFWSKNERWLPLTSVDLELTSSARLPSALCGKDQTPGESDSVSPEETTGGGETPTKRTYPSPDDPNLTCAPDGRSFTYKTCKEVEATPGLCGDEGVDCDTSGARAESLPVGEAAPQGWPCPSPVDAGAP